MAKHEPKGGHRTRARNLCHHFDGTELATSARPGLDSLEAEHKDIVHGGTTIGCGVPLDLCRKMREPDAPRWDYVFVVRDKNDAVAIEVHHTDPNEVSRMIEKKQWAERLLAQQCPNVKVLHWVWLAAPPAGHVFILPQSPNARRLAEAKIHFPRASVDLP
jgi:hypothetical protein